MGSCHLNLYNIYKKCLIVFILFTFSSISEASRTQKPLRRPPWRHNAIYQHLLQTLETQKLQKLRLKSLANARRYLTNSPDVDHSPFRPHLESRLSTSSSHSFSENSRRLKSDCVNALLTFELPLVFKKVGASNIEINEKKDAREDTENSRFLHYDLSFPVNGQIKNIHLRIGRSAPNDRFHSTQAFKRLKDIFGDLPERVFSLVDGLLIEYEVDIEHDFLGKTEWNESQENNIIIYYQYSLHQKNDQVQGLSHAKETMLHELGHVTALHEYRYKSKYGIPKPDQRWLDAIVADSISVSQYGDTAIGEDFAEAMQLYIMINGGLYYPNLAGRYSHRFAILDEIMGLTPSQRKEIIEINNLFEIQTNDLLRRFGLPTADFMSNTPEHVEDLWLLSENDLSLKEMLTEILRYFWRNNFDGLRISKALADKLHILQRKRTLNSNSIENRLTREILENIWVDDTIPEFIVETVHLFDTLSISEMEYRIHILEQASQIFTEKESPITFEQALKEARLLMRGPISYHTGHNHQMALNNPKP